jgi:hypothetical protein
MDNGQPVPGLPGAIMRRVANLPLELPGAVSAGPYVSAKPGQLLAVIPGTGRFFAHGGTTIEFAPEECADDGMISLVLHGTARGALIHQRGDLPLHAATLLRPGCDKALAICGHSGAGKSTLAAELCRRGWTLVADDTTRVTWDKDHPVAWPSRDTIKLWKAALDDAGIDSAPLDRVTRDTEKYYIRVPVLDRPVRLGWIVELTQEPVERELSIGDRMALITRNTYRPAQIAALGMQREHVQMVSRMAQTCTIWRQMSDRTKPVSAGAERVEAIVS